MRRVLCALLAGITVLTASGCDALDRGAQTQPQQMSEVLNKPPKADSSGPEFVFYSYQLIRRLYPANRPHAELMQAALLGAAGAVADQVHTEGTKFGSFRIPIDRELAEAWFLRTLNVVYETYEISDPGAVTAAALRAMTSALGDPETRYLTPETLEAIAKGKSLGLGLMGYADGESLVVREILPGGAAEAAGLRPGDTILDLGGRPPVLPNGRFNFEAESGKTVTARIGRPLVPEFETTLTFATIDLPRTSSRLIGDIGYVGFYSFPNPDSDPGVAFEAEITDILAGLRDRGVRGWVLDLRGVDGVFEETAVATVGRFGYGGVVVEKSYREADLLSVTSKQFSDSGNLPIVVLVDSGTSSYAEVVALTLRDAGLARVIGTKTAGIVSATSIVKLASGSGLQITTHRVLVGPLNRDLMGKGVSPDEVVQESKADLAAGRDTQLERALDSFRARVSPLTSAR